MKKTKKTPGQYGYAAVEASYLADRVRILENLSSTFGAQFSGNAVALFLPPVTVRLSVSEILPDGAILRPDLYIVHNKLAASAVWESDSLPDLVLAILPQENEPDTGSVQTLSAKSGVKELWVLDSLRKSVAVYGVQNDAFVALGSFSEGETIHSSLLPDLVLNTETVFVGREYDATVHEPVMEYGQLDLNGTYTYWNYLRWQFKERVELIRGKIFKMSPAPNLYHQRISRKLSAKFVNFFEEHTCEVFFAPFDAPFDVRLPVAKAKKDTTVVQPDLCVVCDKRKLEIGGCNGAPDLMLEILSPGNSRHEMNTKFNVYEQSGVKEYWIVDFERRLVLLYTLKENVYVGLHPFTEGHVIQSPLFPALQINVDEIFDGVA